MKVIPFALRNLKSKTESIKIRVMADMMITTVLQKSSVKLLKGLKSQQNKIGQLFFNQNVGSFWLVLQNTTCPTKHV